MSGDYWKDLLALALVLLCATAFTYVCFRFLSVIVTLDIAIARGLTPPQPVASDRPTGTMPFINMPPRAVPQDPTDGEFIPYTDEEAFLNERARQLRKEHGLDDTSLDAALEEIIKQKQESQKQ